MYLGVAAHEELAVAGPGGLAGVARHQMPLEDLKGVLQGEQPDFFNPPASSRGPPEWGLLNAYKTYTRPLRVCHLP